ncbi:TATA box-binding protein-associated factor RNA polymerase I subunit B [Arachis duranensis]|uniref:TATA box-binding protein-associated factor RNA polymerase I subunit B n=1 Tax=Arachis duranensis TaxID=130453 RepID=A0A6P5N8X4_ARADU|nr:TATA box-binding protein-associated factor RNA polymerase I subunit B [Arachis duranensis]
MADIDPHTLTCHACGNVGLVDGDDGFFYCNRCGSRSEDVVDTAVDDNDLYKSGGASAGIYLASQQRYRTSTVGLKAEPISQYDSQSVLLRNLGLDDEDNQTPGRSNAVEVKREEENYAPLFGNIHSVPEDFADVAGANVLSFEDYQNEVRMRYVLGLQIMVQLQCEALVKEFKVTPLICGLMQPIWLRFVFGTGVFNDDWADQVIHDSEMQHEEEEPKDRKTRAKYRDEPYNLYGQRAVMIWFRALKKRIPPSCTLAVSFLACHVAREPVLPSDLIKGTLEAKIPYISAFVEIEKRLGRPSSACPISSSVMFKPQRVLMVLKLETFAASIAQFIGLELPPVNFFGIARRYLQRLSLPSEKILPHVSRIYEWAMPPDLWLSLSERHFKLPIHVCVMSILVVAIRMLFNINGSGEWEKSLSNKGNTKDNGEKGTAFSPRDRPNSSEEDSDKDKMKQQENELDTSGLLQHLQAIYNDLADIQDYSKDLSTYLKHCRDVIFAGSEASYGNYKEEKMIEYLWNFYMNEKDTKPSVHGEQSNRSLNETRSRDNASVGRTSQRERTSKEHSNQPSLNDATSLENHLPENVDKDDGDNDKDNDSSKSFRGRDESDSNAHSSEKPHVKEAIARMKLDMEENRFYYIPPIVKKKRRHNYLHYVRKIDEGALEYVAHADYYILLRACARVAQVDVRIMHIGVLKLERRLAWLEEQIDECLQLKPEKISCKFCSDAAPENESDDVPGLSDLDI